MSVLNDVLTDLAAESDQLDGWVADLDEATWATITTSEGWTVAHQIAHLHWTDTASSIAIRGGEGFDVLMTTASADPAGFVDAEAERLAQIPPADLLVQWRAGRPVLAEGLRGVPAGEKIAWFGPSMSPTSMATARFMETWAHSHDVADALGIEVPRTDRVRHVCHLGVRTRGYAHLVRGLDAPAVDVRIELTAPSGQLWTWGDENAADRVTGDAWDFALLASRRRHRDDVAVEAAGEHADAWLDIAQTFAGMPGNDPVQMSER